MVTKYFGQSSCWGGRVQKAKYEVGDYVKFKHENNFVTAEIIVSNGPNWSGVIEYKVKWGNQVRWVYEYEVVLSKFGGHNKCECGAVKTYGKRVNFADHALWCEVRKRK